MISLTNISTISTKKRFVLSFLIISLLTFFIWLLIGTEKQKGPKDSVGSEKYLIEELEVPRRDWQRKIDTKKEDGMQTITNIYDGYRVTVSDEWEVVKEVRSGLFGLVMLYGQEDERNHAYIEDGLVVNVFMFENIDKLSLTGWLFVEKRKQNFFKNDKFSKTEYTSYEIVKTQTPLIEDVWLGGDNFTDALIEDTLSLKYVIKAEGVDTIYVVSCTIYNDVTRFIPKCEEIIPFFEILN